MLWAIAKKLAIIIDHVAIYPVWAIATVLFLGTL